MGGMIAQEYAINHGGDLKSLTLACTYAAPGPFCSRMFAMWADMAPVNGVPFVMRDVTLWAFTVPVLRGAGGRAEGVRGGAWPSMTMSVEAYLAQLNVIQTHDTTDRLGSITVPTLVLAGEEDILIPVRLSKATARGASPEPSGRPVTGGHACLWEHPDAVQPGRSSRSSTSTALSR